MNRRRLLLAVGALLTVAVVVTGCGGGDDAVKTSPTAAPTTTTAGRSSTPSTDSATPVGTVAPDAPGVTLEAIFMRGEKVGTAHRRVAPTKAVGRAAVEQLLAGPTADEQAAGLHTEIPAGTELLDLDIADGAATVDLSGEFVSGGGSLSMRARLAQVVYTLTQFPTVDGVAFRIDGKPTTTFGGEGVLIELVQAPDDVRAALG